MSVLLSLALSLLLVDVGSTVFTGRDFFSRNIPAAPLTPPRASAVYPRRGLELNVAVRPYFLGSQNGPEGTQHGFNGPRYQSPSSGESSDVNGLKDFDQKSDPDPKRRQGKLQNNYFGEIAISVRLEDAYPVLGDEEDRREIPFDITDIKTDTNQNKYDGSYDSTTVSSDKNSRFSRKYVSTTTPLNTVDSTAFDIEKWAKNINNTNGMEFDQGQSSGNNSLSNDTIDTNEYPEDETIIRFPSAK